MSDRSQVRDRVAQGVVANVVGRPVQLVLELAASVLVARFLGPELLAVLVAIRALAALASSVGDFGVTVSLAKIVPDIAARHGRRAALEAARRLTLLRLVTVPLVGAGAWLLAQAGWVNLGGIELTLAMAGASLVLGVLAMVNGSRRYVVLSALRLREILAVDVLAALVGPAVNIAAALLTRDPLAVALSTLVTEAVVFAALHFRLTYDLDADSGAGAAGEAVTLAGLARRYGAFVAMAWAKYVFNRVVLRNPMLLVILGALGAGAGDVGNAAIALSLAFQAWEIANMPLAQMRAPLISRLHARGDRAGMAKLEAVSVGVVTLTSCTLAVAAMAGAEPLVATVYGPAYADAARWSAVACAAGLLANVASLGNSTLQQLENYRVQAAAMAAAVAVIAAGLVALPRLEAPVEPTLAALVLMVGARAVFWTATDLWADRTIFAWASTGTKLRGVVAAAPALGLAAWLAPATLTGGLLAATGAALVFLGLFRALGGIGEESRGVLRGVLPASFAPLLRLV